MNFNLSSSVAMLERTPAVLRALLSNLPDDWVRHNEGPNTWSAFDVVGHLIDGEETDWMTRARIILAKSTSRRFKPFDRFRHLRTNKTKTHRELLDRFAELRARNLEELEGLKLSPNQLQRTGEHPEFGSVTLEQLLPAWVAHDLEHLAQITRVMAKQYSDAGGPWKAYLPELRR